MSVLRKNKKSVIYIYAREILYLMLNCDVEKSLKLKYITRHYD